MKSFVKPVLPVLFFFIFWESPFCYAKSFQLSNWPFFYNDIQSFFGQPYPSRLFTEVETISQEFQSGCTNLNRLVLPVYLKSKVKKGILVFQLYDVRSKSVVHEASINLHQLPAPKPIGTFRQKGVLVHIWFDPQKTSRDKRYRWSLKKSADTEFPEVGVYLTNREIKRLNFFRQDGQPTKDSRASFYSYCEFRFDWDEIGHQVASRLGQETFFLGGYFLIMTGLGIAIARRKKSFGS